MCLFQMRDEWVFYGCLSGSGDCNKATVPKKNVVIRSVCYCGVPATMNCQVLFENNGFFNYLYLKGQRRFYCARLQEQLDESEEHLAVPSEEP